MMSIIIVDNRVAIVSEGFVILKTHETHDEYYHSR